MVRIVIQLRQEFRRECDTIKVRNLKFIEIELPYILLTVLHLKGCDLEDEKFGDIKELPLLKEIFITFKSLPQLSTCFSTNALLFLN